jgi:tRNA threonylcarbamoyladenosine biosynthesis protein TsaB
MNYILHLDTSSDICSVAISYGGELLHVVAGSESRNHAAYINEMIAQVLSLSGVSFSDISAVAVCEGPGSYTGLRIAMATAKGICYANDLPLILHSKLFLVSFSNTYFIDPIPAHSIAAVLIAREMEYFISVYDSSMDCLVASTHIPEPELADILLKQENLHIISDAPKDLFYKLKVNFIDFQENITIDFKFWSKCAFASYISKEFANVATSVPLYLKQVYTHNKL